MNSSYTILILELISAFFAGFFGILLIFVKEKTEREKRWKIIGFLAAMIFTIFFKCVEFRKEKKDLEEHVKEYEKTIDYLQKIREAESVALNKIKRLEDSLRSVAKMQFEMFQRAGLANFPFKDLNLELQYEIPMKLIYKTDDSIRKISKIVDDLYKENDEPFRGNYGAGEFSEISVTAEGKQILNQIRLELPKYMKLYIHDNPGQSNDICANQINVDSLNIINSVNQHIIRLDFIKKTIRFVLRTGHINIIPFHENGNINSLKELEHMYITIAAIKMKEYVEPDHFDNNYRLIAFRFRVPYSAFSLRALATDNPISEGSYRYFKLVFE